MPERTVPAAVTRTVTFEGATPILRVADLDASVAYYVGVLGFEIAWRDGRFGCVRRGDADLMLLRGARVAGAPGCTSP